MYYVNNYCVHVMYVCCTLCFRCVRMVRVMCLVTHDTNTCGMVICAGTIMVGHVLRFSELIDSAVQSITYYLFAYVLSRAWKNNWAVWMTRYVFSLDVAEKQSPEDGNSGRRKDARNTVVTGVNCYRNVEWRTECRSGGQRMAQSYTGPSVCL